MSPAVAVHNRRIQVHNRRIQVHNRRIQVHNRRRFAGGRCTTVERPMPGSALEGPEPTLSAPPQCARAHPNPKPKGVGGASLTLTPPLPGGSLLRPSGTKYS